MSVHATLSCKYRIKPNKAQAASLLDMLADFCPPYNAGLHPRIEARQRQHKSVGCNIEALAPVFLRRPAVRGLALQATSAVLTPQAAKWCVVFHMAVDALERTGHCRYRPRPYQA